MSGHLRQVTPNALDRVRRNPESVEELVHGKVRRIPARSWPCFSGHKNRPRCTRRRCHQQPRRKRADPSAQIFKELAGVGVKVGAGIVGVGIDHGPTEDGLKPGKIVAYSSSSLPAYRQIGGSAAAKFAKSEPR